MHLTYHDSDTHTGTASTAKAGEAGAPEVEITPEMIDAGEEALLKTLGGAVSVFYDPRDLAIEVYQAMRCQGEKARPRSSRHNRVAR